MDKCYESVFKNPTGISTQDINNLRVKIIAFNRALAGRRLSIPMSENIDLNYKEKLTGNIQGLCLIKPLKKYFVETVDLIKVDVCRTANDKLVIMFNDDEKLQFDLRSDIDSILKATPKDVHDAIREYEATGKKTCFWNAKMVAEVVVALNQSNLKDINDMIDELAAQGAALETVNKVVTDDTAEYYKSIGD